MSFMDDLDDMETAEDFLRYFEVPFEQKVVHVNRLHILQRFHDYLGKDGAVEGLEEDAEKARYKDHLLHAYTDFVQSNAIKEKVFKVHQEEAKKMEDRFVSVDSLIRGFGVKEG
jgi:nitrogenase-stabilizing/protective protein